MSSMVTKMVGKKILGETLQNKFGTEDPYFEQVPATRLNGKPSTKKFKKRRKALPPGISEHDGKVLTKVKRRAYRLDMALFSFLGVRFGWGSAIGLFPFAGDAVDAVLALMVLRTADQIEGGLPFIIRFQMLINIALDFAIGLTPFIGDLADALFKANTRNAVLLERHLREKGKKSLEQGNQPVPEVDPSDPKEYDRHHRLNDTTDEPPAYDTHDTTSAQQSGVVDPSRSDTTAPLPPNEARVRENRAWFGRSKKKPVDLEAGNSKIRNDRRGGR